MECNTNCLASSIVGFSVGVTSLIGTTVDVVCAGCVSCCSVVGMALVVVACCCSLIFGTSSFCVVVDSVECNTNFLSSSISGVGVVVSSIIGTAVAVVGVGVDVGAGCVSCCGVVVMALVVVVAGGCSIIFGFMVVSTISFCVVDDSVDCNMNFLVSSIVGFGVDVSSLIGTSVTVVASCVVVVVGSTVVGKNLVIFIVLCLKYLLVQKPRTKHLYKLV